MAYVVPIHHASSVRHAIKSRFLDPEEDCLVVAKAGRLEFYALTHDGLVLRHSKAMYGQATFLKSLPRPDPSETDVLFVGTDRYTYFTLSWDPATQQLRTEQKYVDLADTALRDVQNGERCLVDPTGRFMTLEVYEGVVTVIPITWGEIPGRSQKQGQTSAHAHGRHPPGGGLADAIPARIEELAVRSSAFLDRDKGDTKPPRLAILYEDTTGDVKLKLRELVYTHTTVTGDGGPSVELNEVDVLSGDRDLGASMLIPVPNPLGGLLILGEKNIQYVDERNNVVVSQSLEEPTIFVAWEQIDGQRWLLADDYGRLFFLMLTLNEDDAVEKWKIDFLGETSRASVLVYLGAGVVFVGSHQGDSKVIKIMEGSFDTIQTISNIAPILDFTIMDLGNRSNDSQTHEFSSGQARIITGSGAFNDGSLRSVRSGVGMEELGILGSMEHITDLWGLRVSCGEGFLDTLLVSFVTETRIFQFSPDGEVEEKDEFLGLSLTEPTILTANVPGHRILQVCERTARVSDIDGGMVMWEWSPPANQAITAASSNDNYLILVVGGQDLVVFDIGNEVTAICTKEGQPDRQVSGVTLTPSPAQACIVCLPQTAEIEVLVVPDLVVKQTSTLGTPGEAVPRSVLVANVLAGKPATLFVAMADGSVISFSFDINDHSLSNPSKLILGSEPPSFKKLPRRDGLHSVFATCEHPSLIYGSEDRIVYSAVNTEGASRICHFHSEAYPGAIAVATPTELKVALVDAERTTQIQTLHMSETVRRVAYSATERAFGIGTIERTIEKGVENIKSRFVLADEIMFRKLSSYDLNQDELVESVIKAEFPEGQDDEGDQQFKDYFIVGTAYLDHLSDSTTRGRILVFEVTPSRELMLVAEKQLKGACRALAMLDGKIVAALVKTVVVFNVNRGGPSDISLEKSASYRTSTAPIDIAVAGNVIAVADLMKSISLVEYKRGEDGAADNLTEVARHFQTLWSTAVACVAENCFLVSDAEGNLVVVNRNVNGVTDDDKRRMEVTGEIRLGEMVNRIQSVNIQTTGASPVVPRAILATVEGSIYLFCLINPNHQDLLMRLQSAIGSVVMTPGEMPFNQYRALKTKVRQAEEPFRFVDGELVERFLSCPRELQEDIVGRLADKGVTVEFVKDMIEELRRMH
ncbi:hypothetical protein VTO42DRAFT_1727 [Malbranchea cinnamomea]